MEALCTSETLVTNYDTAMDSFTVARTPRIKILSVETKEHTFGKLYSSEYTEIQNVFFTPHYAR